MSDAEAIARSCSEPSAFGAVFDRHFQAVYAYAQLRVGLALAEEVAAETFARAFELRARQYADEVAHGGTVPGGKPITVEESSKEALGCSQYG